ncbi:sugar kinase [Novosphingobium rhizosphaerae]|uniref:sugar kinase n=1 Tax=Novosphingobium rhizosphaerae TaxID=1551649 RepID=UPI00179D9EF7
MTGRIVCLGEGMLELSGAGETFRLGHGGDTLNTAIHLARAGHDVAYFTALGRDPFSTKLRAAWRDEGVGDSLILTHPTRGAGLYAISTDAQGERSFTYWREASAARAMFALPETASAMDRAAQAALLYFSLISLAILPDEGRSALLALAARVRANGGEVAFDSNYRPRLWESEAAARAWHARAVAAASIGLPTLEDETALTGETDAAVVAARWQAQGCARTVVKSGAEGARLPGGETIPPPARLQPIDTSGAGDAFNAGFLGAVLRGSDDTAAVLAGHACAGWTIMRPGAIPARD